MPLDVYYQGLFALYGGVGSLRQAWSDPELAERVASYKAGLPSIAPPDGTIVEEHVPTSVGDVRVRIYEPPDDGPLPPALVWVHGGGFAGGSIDMVESDTVARELAFGSGILVVAVDYALSNGGSVTYPTPHTQVTEVFRWLRGQADRFALDAQRLCLGGASAGANLAMAAVWELLGAGEAPPRRLVLAYPFLHRTMAPIAAGSELARIPAALVFDQSIADELFGLYTGGRAARFASLEGNTLVGFPPTLVLVGEYDDLRVSGHLFHERARADGVVTDLEVCPGMMHGFLDASRTVAEVGRAVARLGEYIASDSAHSS